MTPLAASATRPSQGRPGQTKTRLRCLHHAGVTNDHIARLTGIPRHELDAIASGHALHVTQLAERAVLALRPEDIPWSLVDAAGTWRRIDQLLEHGITRKQIAQHVTGRASAQRLELSRERITRRAAARVRALYDQQLLGGPPVDDEPEPEPDRRRFPIDPLLAVAAGRGMSDRALGDLAGIRVDRAQDTGLNAGQADRAATALGLHPDSLWPTYTAGGQP